MSVMYTWQVALVMSDSLQPMDCSPPGPSVHGIFQASILEWVVITFSRGSLNPGINLMSPASRDASHVSCIGRWILYH